MSNILVVTGSARPNSVNEQVVPLVVAELEKQGATATIADLQKINLPFFDGPLPPSSPDFTPLNEAAQQWTQLVVDADAVVFVTPEYNHTLTPLQINAIDWIGKEWEAKPVGLVGYGWGTGGGQAHDAAREALAVNLKANVSETAANLFFMKDISPDGKLIETGEAVEKIAAAVTAVTATTAVLADS